MEWRVCVSENDAVLRELRGDADGLTTYTRRMATAIVIMSVVLVPSVTPWAGYADGDGPAARVPPG